jgi:DNA-binding NtrC family response regulator
MMPNILVVDDEKSIQDSLRWAFEKEDWHVVTAGCASEGLAHLDAQDFDVVVSDILLPDVSGLEILQRARTLRSAPAVMLITAYATVDTAIEALRRGAVDYVRKPFRLEDLRFRVKRLLQERGATSRRRPGSTTRPAPDRAIIGSSQAITAVRVKIARCATSTSNVLITGESGTGKELVARAIHAASPRRDEPFVAVNCGAIPEPLFESQLFGHARGAFTGAVQANPGLFVTARRGTLVLDEVGEMPPALQVKLLRVIEDKEVWPVGATTPISIETRIIASTNRDLRADVTTRRFREDLFYRLNTVHVAVPPLRERRHDIPLLVEHFIARFNGHLGRNVHSVMPDALELLVNCEWRGNVRELEHVIESAMTSGEGDAITAQDLPPDLRAERGDGSLREAMRRFERQHILDVLNQSDFDKREAARRLGLSVASLYRKLGAPAS